MPDTDDHELRTFLLGPKGGTRVECWCGWVSEEEFMDQPSARREHEHHRNQMITEDERER